jgi:dinuclear metal center YbgI/SA1388 family protein
VHHPLIFHNLKRLTDDTRAGRLALRILGGRRALIAAHTNLDGAEGGLCDLLGRMAGLVDLEPVQHPPPQGRYKIVVFVPRENLEAVRAAAFAAGGGRIGNYTECSFASEGQGTFFAGEATRPAVGARGRRNAVPEHRLEVLVPENCLARVLAAVARAHVYEEPAVDVYPVKVVAPHAGVGRIGRLRRPLALARFAANVKRALRLRGVGVAGDPAWRVERVAVCSGAGSGLAAAVKAAGVQAFLTGELPMHDVQELTAFGIGAVLAGHYETERIPMAAWLPRLARTLDVEVMMSRRERGPLILK